MAEGFDGGLPVVILPNAEYEAHCLKPESGSRLYLYLSGICDCSNPAVMFPVMNGCGNCWKTNAARHWRKCDMHRLAERVYQAQEARFCREDILAARRSGCGCCGRGPIPTA